MLEMLKMLEKIYQTHKIFWTKQNIVLFLKSILFFLFALVVQHFAYVYIDGYVEGTHVGDLILDNVPVLNLDLFIVQGALIFTLLIVLLLLEKPKYASFSMKTLAFFLVVRSFFFSLTHLGTNLHQIALNTDSIGFGIYNFLYNAKNDFFFSGHVGASFLFMLIFWQEKNWRNVFLAISCVFAASMLFAHMHYSIDIFAAPFITYGVFVISKKLFYKDYKLTIT